jgi:hypothetical protein
MAAYLPPGWPTGVHPPSSEGFERTAVAWLLDVVPPDYRLHGVLQRHPIALATLARRHLAACVEGARQGYRTARTELGGALPVSGVDAVLAAYRSEGRRLVTAARAADLVERALRGKEFTPQLHQAPAPPGQQEQQEQRERRGQQEQQELPAQRGQQELAAQRGEQERPAQHGQQERPAQRGQQERPAQHGQQERPGQPTPGKQKARQPTPVKQQQAVKQQPAKQPQPVKQQQKQAAAAPAKQRRKQAVS